VDQGFQLLTLVRAQTDDVLLDLGLSHDPIPGDVSTLPDSHRSWSESTT
jgi:hypothetical protein